MLAARLHVTVVVSAAGETAAVVAVLEANAVIDKKAAQKDALTDEERDVAQSAANVAQNNVVRAKSRASHVRRGKRVNRASNANNAKGAVATNVRAVNAANELSGATSNAPRWIQLSKTSPRPTKLPWQQPWAVLRLMQRKKRRAASVVSAVAATTDVVSRVKIVKTLLMPRQANRLSILM